MEYSMRYRLRLTRLIDVYYACHTRLFMSFRKITIETIRSGERCYKTEIETIRSGERCYKTD